MICMTRCLWILIGVAGISCTHKESLVYEADTSAVDVQSWVGTSQLLRVSYLEDGKHTRTYKGFLEHSGTDLYADLYLYDGDHSRRSGLLVPLRIEHITRISLIENDGHRAADWIALGAIAGGALLVTILIATGSLRN